MIGIVMIDRRDMDKPGHVRPQGGEAELSYVFLPQAWGHGYANEACTAAINWFDGALPSEPLVLCTQVANERSMRLAVRLGFAEAERFEQYGAQQWFGVRWDHDLDSTTAVRLVAQAAKTISEMPPEAMGRARRLAFRRMASARSSELLELARRIVDALPHDVVREAAVTGSVSRGVADGLSDIEMLLVTPAELSLDECFELAGGAGLEQMSTWGPQNVPTRRVFGYFQGVPIELIWWSLRHAKTAFAGSGDAIVHAVPLRTAGDIGRWKAELATVPVETICEEAALPWGGFAPEGILTITRPSETFSRLEWTVDGANRVLRIVYAVNGRWPPTSKRLYERSDHLSAKPERLAERIEDALTEREPRRALHVLTELQLDAVRLAPDGPNVLRARDWLTQVLNLL